MSDSVITKLPLPTVTLGLALPPVIVKLSTSAPEPLDTKFLIDPAVPPASSPPYISTSPPFPPPAAAVPPLSVSLPALPELLLPASIVTGCPAVLDVVALGFISTEAVLLNLIPPPAKFKTSES